MAKLFPNALGGDGSSGRITHISVPLTHEQAGAAAGWLAGAAGRRALNHRRGALPARDPPPARPCQRSCLLVLVTAAPLRVPPRATRRVRPAPCAAPSAQFSDMMNKRVVLAWNADRVDAGAWAAKCGGRAADPDAPDAHCRAELGVGARGRRARERGCVGSGGARVPTGQGPPSPLLACRSPGAHACGQPEFVANASVATPAPGAKTQPPPPATEQALPTPSPSP
jgi:hypothetical protein